MKENAISGVARQRQGTSRLHLAPLVAAVGLALGSGAVQAADLSHLQGLLDATPQGGWVKANVGKFSDAFPTGSVAVPHTTSHTLPGAVVRAWSSFAWDSARGNLLIYGGGHSNYRGNEVYVWSGSSGGWSRGSLPSAIENYVPAGADPRTYLVVDDAAPQSAHTYDGNLYLPKNDMFMTLGGGVYNSGDIFQTRNSAGELVRAGPWLWDPNKADANKIGGTTGSGYNPATLGGNMWTNRHGQWVGTEPRSYSNNTTAYRTEGNRDVVYMTTPAEYSGFPALYRYTLGDVRNGGTDTWERIGESYYAPSGTATAVIDERRNLYVHTTANQLAVDLGVWDLSKANAANPALNRDIAIELVNADGSAFAMNVNYGMAYDQQSGKLLLWDGADLGTVWETEAVVDASGTVSTQWVVKRLTSSTASQPGGNFATGVMGKWHYVSALGAFVALNEFSATTQDAEVWFYKPLAAVPEPASYLLWLAGLGAVGLLSRRRSPKAA